MLLLSNASPGCKDNIFYRTLDALPEFSPLPEKFHRKDWVLPSLAETYIKKPSKLGLTLTDNYVAKTHLFGNEVYRDLAANKSVLIVNLICDVRDMVLERYCSDFVRDEGSNSIDIKYYFDSKNAFHRIKNMVDYLDFWYGESPIDEQSILISGEVLLSNIKEGLRPLLEKISFVNLMTAEDYDNVSKAAFPFKYRKLVSENNPSIYTADYYYEMSVGHSDMVLSILEDLDYISLKRKIVEKFPSLYESLSTTDVGV
jgi:hypothetical protein